MKKLFKLLAFVSVLAGIFASVYYILKKLGYICDCNGECDECDSYDECFGQDLDTDYEEISAAN